MRRSPAGKRRASDMARLKASITFLEMIARPAHRPPLPAGPAVALLRVRNMMPAYYRFLYREVGKEHHWMLRRRMDDAALDAIINAPTTRIDVLYVDGCPAGFFELDSSRLPAEVEIAYFGLIGSYTGLGLGKWLLGAAIDAAWDLTPEKVTVKESSKL